LFFFFWALWRDFLFQLKFYFEVSFSSEKDKFGFWKIDNESQRYTISNRALSLAHLSKELGAWLPVWSRVLIMPNQAEIYNCFLNLDKNFKISIFSTYEIRKSEITKEYYENKKSTNSYTKEKAPCSLSFEFYRCVFIFNKITTEVEI